MFFFEALVLKILSPRCCRFTPGINYSLRWGGTSYCFIQFKRIIKRICNMLNPFLLIDRINDCYKVTDNCICKALNLEQWTHSSSQNRKLCDREKICGWKSNEDSFFAHLPSSFYIALRFVVFLWNHMYKNTKRFYNRVRLVSHVKSVNY